jgi:DNA-binding HxlR family transcriptional regulator
LTHDPFWSQKSTRSRNRREILKLIAERPRTFGELLEGTPDFHVSRPILSNHLKALEQDSLIRRRVSGKRIEYELTERGSNLEELRKKSIPIAVDLIKLLVQEPSATKTLSDLSEWAEENPTLVELFMKEFGQIMANDAVLQWIAKHPGREGANVVKRELMKRMGKPGQLDRLENHEKVKATFLLLSEAFRDITGSKESKKVQDH